MKTTIVCLLAATMSVMASGIASGHPKASGALTAPGLAERAEVIDERGDTADLEPVAPRPAKEERAISPAAARAVNAKNPEPAATPDTRVVRTAVLRHSARF